MKVKVFNGFKLAFIRLPVRMRMQAGGSILIALVPTLLRGNAYLLRKDVCMFIRRMRL